MKSSKLNNYLNRDPMNVLFNYRMCKTVNPKHLDGQH